MKNYLHHRSTLRLIIHILHYGSTFCYIITIAVNYCMKDTWSSFVVSLLILNHYNQEPVSCVRHSLTYHVLSSFCLFSRSHSYNLIRDIILKKIDLDPNVPLHARIYARSQLCNYARCIVKRGREKEKIFFVFKHRFAPLYENTRVSDNRKNYGNLSRTGTFTFTKTYRK